MSVFKDAWNGLKNLRAFNRGKKAGKQMAAKTTLASKSMLGALIATAGALIGYVGQDLQDGSIDWGALLPKVAEFGGILFAVFGIRRAVGKGIETSQAAVEIGVLTTQAAAAAPSTPKAEAIVKEAEKIERVHGPNT